MIFFDGFDITKEIMALTVKETFRRRGWNCITIDSPGVGEPLRLRNVPSRFDYEVPAGAVIDYLETRPDVDASRIAVMGISLGGYYAPRAAAFEPRIKACVAWGAILDYGGTWVKRLETQTKTTSVPYFQLPWVMGAATFDEAMEKVRKFDLTEALPHITQPTLILHGESDKQIPLADAQRAFELVGSKDKELPRVHRRRGRRRALPDRRAGGRAAADRRLGQAEARLTAAMTRQRAESRSRPVPTLARSVMFVPGDDERKLARAGSVAADALIIDLEDAVADARKDMATDLLAEVVPGLLRTHRVYVRLNSLVTGRTEHEVRAAAAAGAVGVIPTKTTHADEIREIETMIPSGNEALGIVPLIETAGAVMRVAEIASASARSNGSPSESATSPTT